MNTFRMSNMPLKSRIPTVRVLRALFFLVLLSAPLIGCGEKSPEQKRNDLELTLAKFETASRERDIGTLQTLGTGEFEANTYLNHLMRGVEGNFAFRRTRTKSYPDEASVEIEVNFGPDGASGIKQLKLSLIFDRAWKIDGYRFTDVRIPAARQPDTAAHGESPDSL